MTEPDTLVAIHRSALHNVVGGRSPTENELIAQLDPKARQRYLLQKKLQNTSERAALLSQMQSQRHRTAMSIIGNIR